jgi:hypothetical protein
VQLDGSSKSGLEYRKQIKELPSAFIVILHASLVLVLIHCRNKSTLHGVELINSIQSILLLAKVINKTDTTLYTSFTEGKRPLVRPTGKNE